MAHGLLFAAIGELYRGKQLQNVCSLCPPQLNPSLRVRVRVTIMCRGSRSVGLHSALGVQYPRLVALFLTSLLLWSRENSDCNTNTE